MKNGKIPKAGNVILASIQFLHKIQQTKMRELWDKEGDEEWQDTKGWKCNPCIGSIYIKCRSIKSHFLIFLQIFNTLFISSSLEFFEFFN